MPKKLKVVVKSLYSHEIRKDASLADLRSLKLEDAWPFMREEIETEIASNQLVCIPHVTESELYAASSLFLQEKPDCSLTPLGLLSSLVDSDRIEAALLKDVTADFIDSQFKFPHESVKITLQDEVLKNKVRVIMVNLTRAATPASVNQARGLRLQLDKHPALKAAAESGEAFIYMVSSTLRVGTLEFRVTRTSSSRIFHLGTPTPLVFALHGYQLLPGGTLVPKGAVSNDHKLTWNRMDMSDHLYTTDLNNAALYE